VSRQISAECLDREWHILCCKVVVDLTSRDGARAVDPRISMPAERATNILLVDDDEIDVMNVRRAFQKGKITNPLFVAEDGLIALEMLRCGPLPEERRLVLLDLNMPRMNGIEFLRELRADLQLRATPVVVLTTSAEERDRVEAYGLHVAGYLVKPVRFAAFVELMTTLTRYWSTMEMS
jgi:CheY-like chemotaxis protein